MIPTLTVLFENKDVMAIDKPEGLPSIPGRSKSETDVLSLLSDQTGQKLFVVHRLDKDVSGVLLFAKNREAHKFLNDQFAERSLHKTYVALVQGVVKDETGFVQRPIRQFGSGRMGVDENDGKPCTTKFVVMERLHQFTLLKVFPLTGRRHQIRVHLYAVGHAIAGDRLYGDPSVQKKFPRLMLHAHELEFVLPFEKTIKIQSPLPEAFRGILESVKPKLDRM